MAPNQTDNMQPDRVSRYGDAKPAEMSTEEEVTPEQVPGIVEGLRAAFASERTLSRGWRVQQLKQLRRMIVECEDELCAAMYKDLHKSQFEAYATELGLVLSEIDTALEHLDEWMRPQRTRNSALNIPSWSTTQHDALGVVYIASAWNYPSQLALAPLVGAIAGGNCALIKPGSYAVHTSNALARCVKRYMDQDCVRVIEGNRHVTNACLAQRFDLIFFTGSGYVGRIVAKAAAEHLTPCILELGGKSPCVVDQSADLDHAAERLVWGAFLNCGQTCVRPDFVMVHAAVADAFVRKLKETVRRFYGEDPQRSESFGRVINDAAFERLSALVSEERARLVTGGQTDAADRYVAPSIFDFGTDLEAFQKSPLMQDEIFGPLMPLVRYVDTEEAVQFAKTLITGKPLALYAYARDAAFIRTIKTRTTSGGLCINDNLMHLSNHELPFGGVGNSGMGRYHGKYSFDSFTHEKAVLEKSPMLDNSPFLKPLLAARFPPYNSTFKDVLVRRFGAHSAEKLVNLPVPAFRALLKLLLAYVVMRALGLKIVRA